MNNAACADRHGGKKGGGAGRLLFQRLRGGRHRAEPLVVKTHTAICTRLRVGIPRHDSPVTCMAPPPSVALLHMCIPDSPLPP